jgi:hypothetical protein
MPVQASTKEKGKGVVSRRIVYPHNEHQILDYVPRLMMRRESMTLIVKRTYVPWALVSNQALTEICTINRQNTPKTTAFRLKYIA